MRESASTMTLTSHSITETVIVILITISLFTLIYIFKIKPKDVLYAVLRFLTRLVGKRISRMESDYERGVQIGRINDNSLTVKIHQWLNDLIIDLDLKKKGVTPYELLFFANMASLIISLLMGTLLFGSLVFSVLAYMPLLIAVLCLLYTKANVSHDNRIEDVILAENIISNNIDKGVVVAVKSNLDSMPRSLFNAFRDFIDDVEETNSHIEVALLRLQDNLGSISKDFIQKCITLELEEEVGLVGIFKDVVEVNNIKSELRISMKRKFDAVVADFIVGILMIFGFLGGLFLMYPYIRNLYLTTIVGQIILLIDFILIISEFVIITALRAEEI